MPRLKIEVVVIGSSFGGSVAAARIAEAGAWVTLLERGPGEISANASHRHDGGHRADKGYHNYRADLECGPQLMTAPP